ncbi:hypothetical protein QE152_g36264 [Popillia japonica]|uniref:Maturase K n=1 Tax=Popillia japonica TaxID=7064 RepID=A0AAW1ID98_POPJA
MKSFRFDDRRTDARYKSCYSDNYHLQFIFWSSGVKQTSLLECSFEQLKQYKEEENLDDFPQKSQLAAVYDFAMTFCVFALKSKPQNGLVKKFYNQWKLIFPPDIYPEFMRLEFLDLYFDCKCDMEEFCKKSNVLMRVYVRKYGEMIMKIYSTELMGFVRVARINKMDFLTSFILSKPDRSTELMGFVRVARINKMDFLTSFILSKPDRLSYCAVLKVLPGISSVKFTQEQPSLAKLMDRFRADPDPSVKLHYSYYLLYEYKD